MISIVRAATDRGKWSSRRPDLLALLLLVLIVLWFTGPVVLHPGSWLYGKGQDGFGAPAALAENLWYHHFPTPFWQPSGLLGAPFSVPDITASADLLWWDVATLLASAIHSPIAATNLMIFLGLTLTPLIFYFFCRSARLSPFASFLAAVIYGFAPQRIAQAQQHFLLLDGFWFVLLLALLLSLWKSSDIWKGILIGIVLGMTELDNPYLAYFALLATGASFLVLLICRVQQSIRREAFLLFMTGIASLATTALIVIPLQFPALLQASSTPSFRSANSPLHRPLSDLNSYSLRWWDLLLPFPENPLIGPLGRQTFATHVGAANQTEMSVMTGYIALALACTGAFVTLRAVRQTPSKKTTCWAPNLTQRRLALLAGTWIITGILFGLPPLFQIGAVTIPTPPYFMHAIFPEIRTLSRSDLIIQLGLAIFAAFGAQTIYARLRSLPQRFLLAAALSIGILLEYTNVPPWHYAKLLPVPHVYRWLASLSPQQAGIVVQYPLQPAYLSHTVFYAFYDYAVYHHPLFNGVPSDTPPDYLRSNLADILNPTTPTSLAALGIRTAVLDTTYYIPYYKDAHLHWNSGPTSYADRLPAGLVLRFQDSQATGYAVTAQPAHVLAGGAQGFGNPTLQRDGRQWRWLGSDDSLWLYNPTSAPVRVAVWTLVHNNARQHLIAWQGFAPIPISTAHYSTPVALPATATPGFHRYTFSIEGVYQPVQGRNDPRPVTVQVRSLEPEPLHALSASFLENGEPIWQLTGFSLDACAIQAGQPLDVALFWQVQRQTSTNLIVFLHLLDAAGRLVATGDGPPDSGQVSTATASPGAQVVDVHTVQLPSALPPGTYRLTAGLYDRRSGVRLAVADMGSEITLGTVKVLSRSPGPHRMACPW